VATATVCARFGLECHVYMGEEDIRRQHPNVVRMHMLGADVIPVSSGSATLKDAMNEAIRDWITNVQSTHYLIGSAARAAPVPDARARPAIRDRREAARAVPGARGPADPTPCGLRRRRLERDRPLPPLLDDAGRPPALGREGGGDGTGDAADASRGAACRVPPRVAKLRLAGRDGPVCSRSHSISAGSTTPGAARALLSEGAGRAA
jgi:hypothetical protein